MTTSLANLDFGEQSITIYGSQNDPLIKCSDLLIHVLGYKRETDCRVFRKLKENVEFVTMVKHHDVSLDACGKVPHEEYFTEDGIYEVLFLSKQEVAQQFKKQVRTLLKKIRLQTIQQLEESRLQLEEEKKKHEETKQNEIDLLNKQPASIYRIKRNGQTIYVGKDKSLNQSRIPSHLLERQKIMSNYQYIDIVLATMNLEDIQIEQTPCLFTETDQRETELIQEISPMCNQSMNLECIHKCTKCLKVYKSRGWLQRHEIKGCE